MKDGGTYLTALRRGVALGLVVTALWGVGQMTAVSAPSVQSGFFNPPSGVRVALLRRQLGDEGEKKEALSGWGRLLFAQSPLLAAGEEDVLLLRTQGGVDPEQPDPLEGDDEDENQAKPELEAPPRQDGIVEMTGVGKQGGNYLWGQGVCAYNRTKLTLTEKVLTEGKVNFTLGDGPQILIVHTHGSEAYSQSDGDRYEESDSYRTTDCTHNVVKVGEEMATVFRAYGLQVVHDTTLYDYPSYKGAYDRSRAGVEQWLKEYPSIRVVLDVHRDALVGKEGQVYKMVSTEAGQKVAQVMLVMGTSGSGAEHPRWKDNLAFAIKLQQGLVKGYDHLARPIVLRNSRYNQQLLPGSVLVEVGGHGNTLSEAIAGARLWADNVARTLLTMKKK